MINLFFIFIAPTLAFSDTVYTCKEDRSVSIEWNKITDKEPVAIAKNETKEPSIFSLSISEKKAILYGNAAKITLKRISKNAFIEENSLGDVFLWTVFPGNAEEKTYIFQQKNYKLIKPYALMIAYKCN